MDGGVAGSSSSCPPPSPARGGEEMGLQRPQPLPWLKVDKVVMAEDGGEDQDLAGSAAAAKAGKQRPSPAAKAGVARGLKVLVSGLVEMVGKRFECSIPAVKFGHVAYIR